MHYQPFSCNDTATTEIYTLSLHDALPICSQRRTLRFPSLRMYSALISRSLMVALMPRLSMTGSLLRPTSLSSAKFCRSEEHTSELQSHVNLVCRLLLEKKKKAQR